MTDLTSPVPDEFAPSRTGPPLTAYGLALLPLGLAGLMPLWGAALVCGLFALGVRFPVWAQARLLGTQFILGLSVAAQVPAALGHPGQLLSLAATYLLLSVSGFALDWAARHLSEGSRSGFLGLLPALIAPQPGLLLALIGGALARPARDNGYAPRTAPGWWRWLAGGTVIVILLGALLPAPHLNIQMPVSTATPSHPQHPHTAPSAEPVAPGWATLASRLPYRIDPGQSPLLSLDWVLVLALLCLVSALTIPVLRGRTGTGVSLAERVMAAGLLTLGAMWFLAAWLLYTSGTEAGGSRSDAPAQSGLADLIRQFTQGPDHARLIHLPWLVPTLIGLTLLLMALLAGSLLWARFRSPAPLDGTGPGADPAGATPVAPPAPLHRVRVAYRGALAALSDAGLGRAAHETPSGYAARLGAHHPPLADPLGTLTALYEPVRYGGQLTDEQAGQAEQAARAVLKIIPTLPPAEDPTDHKDIP